MRATTGTGKVRKTLHVWCTLVMVSRASRGPQLGFAISLMSTPPIKAFEPAAFKTQHLRLWSLASSSMVPIKRPIRAKLRVLSFLSLSIVTVATLLSCEYSTRTSPGPDEEEEEAKCLREALCRATDLLIGADDVMEATRLAEASPEFRKLKSTRDERIIFGEEWRTKCVLGERKEGNPLSSSLKRPLFTGSTAPRRGQVLRDLKMTNTSDLPLFKSFTGRGGRQLASVLVLFSLSLLCVRPPPPPITIALRDVSATIPYHVERAMAKDQSPNCSLWGWTRRLAPARVFDIFLYNGEEDLLEIRLRELDSVVDGFIAVDSPFSFTNRTKEVLDLAPGTRFAKFQKLRHVSVPFLPGDTTWEREAYLRREGYRIGAESASIKPGDLVILSDLDEIPRASVVNRLKRCSGWRDPVALWTRLYFYSFEFRGDPGKPMDWPKVMFVTHPGNGEELVDQTALREGKIHFSPTHIPNAGWHCSWCFDDLDDFVKKLGDYSHKEHDHPRFRDKAHIVSSILLQLDIVDRTSDGVVFFREKEPLEMPSWLGLERPKELSYLWDRDSWARRLGYDPEEIRRQNHTEFPVFFGPRQGPADSK